MGSSYQDYLRHHGAPELQGYSFFFFQIENFSTTSTYTLTNTRCRADKICMKLLFDSLFVRQGAGSRLFLPVVQSRYWNVIAWAVIVLGTLAWAAFLFMWNV